MTAARRGSMVQMQRAAATQQQAEEQLAEATGEIERLRAQLLEVEDAHAELQAQAQVDAEDAAALHAENERLADVVRTLEGHLQKANAASESAGRLHEWRLGRNGGGGEAAESPRRGGTARSRGDAQHHRDASPRRGGGGGGGGGRRRRRSSRWLRRAAGCWWRRRWR